MKKIFDVFILMCFVFCIAAVPAYANASQELSSDDATEIKQTVQEFFEAYLENAYLYTNNDFTQQTVISKETAQNAKSTFVIDGENKSLADLCDNISYIRDKVAYWQYMRKDAGIERTDFKTEFSFDSVNINNNTANVKLAAYMSFQYADSDLPSYMEAIYSATLVKLDNRWLIADVTEANDWFDATYKNDDSFDVDRIIRDYEAEKASSSEGGLDYEAASVSRVGTSLSYNQANAAAYAYTYTTSTSATPTDFYNNNFQYFSSDCMNFASQCVWAGFGGSNDVTSINNHGVPMDATGSYNWFSSKTQNDHSASWSSCSSFRTYASNSNSATSETGLRTTKYSLGSTDSFSVVTNYSTVLLGAVLNVPGSSGDYGHAVIVTDVTGSSRSNVYYCAHTNMAKNIKISDSWNTGKIYVYIPTSFYSSTTLSSPRISVDMYRPVAQNTTQTLTATTDVSCYRIATTVTTPGGSSSTSNTYNASSATRSYTFSSTGLYTIKVSAYLTSSSSAVDHYYTIRVY